MILIGTSALKVSFGIKTVLSNITFSVEEGNRVGVIGANGAGKTTLFRCLSGKLAPDSGTVSLSKGKSVGMLDQVTDLSSLTSVTLEGYMEAAFPELLEAEAELSSIEKEMALAAKGGNNERSIQLSARYDAVYRKYTEEGGTTYRAKCRSMLTHLGFDEKEQKRTVSSVSGGQHTRLSLARLLAREPDLLLLDEPTNHLDIDALTWLEEYLSTYPKTVMIISHDRYFLDRVTDHTLEIERTHAVYYKGNYTEAKAKREADEASREKRRREQMKIRARIEANIAFQRRCGQEHNFVTIRSKEKQLARMETIEETKALRTVRLHFNEQAESAGDVLSARHLCFSFGKRPLLSDVSFLIQKGERVLFLGANGTGKSTLMKLICGELSPVSGQLTLGYNIVIGYYDQELQGLCPEKTIFEELHDTYPNRGDGEIRSALALFLFGPQEILQRIDTLSGGERARILLCKLMMRKVNLLVMDEPTNHLDIASKEALETALSEFEGTVIAVSHDRYFIDRVASRIIELSPESENGILDYPLEKEEGAYSAYLRLREQRCGIKKEAVTEKAPTDARQQYERQKKERAEQKSEQKKRETATRRIAELEAELTALETELNTSAATDYLRAAELVRRREEMEEALLSLYEIVES